MFTPAWALMPHRARCDTRRSLSNGFFTRQELEDYIETHSEEEFTILTPIEGENTDVHPQ